MTARRWKCVCVCTCASRDTARLLHLSKKAILVASSEYLYGAQLNTGVSTTSVEQMMHKCAWFIHNLLLYLAQSPRVMLLRMWNSAVHTKSMNCFSFNPCAHTPKMPAGSPTFSNRSGLYVDCISAVYRLCYRPTATQDGVQEFLWILERISQ